MAMLPGILVINERYVPEAATCPAVVGATAYVEAAASSLQNRGILAGLILCQNRAPELAIAMAAPVREPYCLCCKVSFNPTMPKNEVKSAFRSAAMQLFDHWRHSHQMPEHSNSNSDNLEIAIAPDQKQRATIPTPMLYYHSGILLIYNPDDIPCCVTHHSPFFDHVLQHFPVAEVAMAVGSMEKLDLLLKQQEEGISCLKSRQDIFVLQHSPVQQSYLMKQIAMDNKNPNSADLSNRVRFVRPPICAKPSNLSSEISSELISFTETQETVICTAMARIEFYKNAEMLVEAGVELICKRGAKIRVLVIGGGEGEADEKLRKELVEGKVPLEYRKQFMAMAKLDRVGVFRVFERLREKKGIFVCCSRYETMGLTPLEAAICGVTTLVVDSVNVGVSTMFPRRFKFEPSLVGLVNTVIGMVTVNPWGSSLEELGLALQGHFQELVSMAGFSEDLLAAWAHFSTFYMSNKSLVNHNHC